MAVYAYRRTVHPETVCKEGAATMTDYKKDVMAVRKACSAALRDNGYALKSDYPATDIRDIAIGLGHKDGAPECAERFRIEIPICSGIANEPAHSDRNKLLTEQIAVVIQNVGILKRIYPGSIVVIEMCTEEDLGESPVPEAVTCAMHVTTFRQSPDQEPDHDFIASVELVSV